MAEIFRCLGCEAIEFAREAIPGHQKGAYVGLIPFNDWDENDEEFEDEELED